MATPTATTTFDPTAKARSAIECALACLHHEVADKARKTYGLVDDDRPRTAQELVDRITKGDITLPDTKADNYDPFDYAYESFLGIRFRNPAKPKDRLGFDEHMEKFRKASHDLNLEIKVLDPEKTLASYKKLEKEWLN